VGCDDAPASARAKQRLWSGLRLAREHPASVVAAAYLVVIGFAAVLAPVIAPWNPNEVNYNSLYEGPSAQHLLGTDDLGRDLLSRIIYSGRVSLVGVGVALAVYLVLGLTLGLLAGYFGGLIDGLVVWVADVSFGVPQIIVILAFLAIFANDSSAAMLVLGLLGAPGLAMLTRGATRAVRAEQYIAAARVSGLRGRQIIVRHIAPRIAGPVIVQTSLFAGLALIFQTGLDFLGIGTQPPTASWGAMVAEGSVYLARDPWMVVPSGAVIALTITAFGLIGDGVRDWNSGRTISVLAVAASTTEPSSTLGALGTGEEAMSTAKRSLSVVDALARTDRASVDGRTKGSRVVGTLLSLDDLSIGIVTKSGEPVPLVDRLSLDLNPGEVLGVVGESGCGKTMTALAIMGLLPTGVQITGGSVTLKGMQVQNLGEREMRRLRGSRMSMISQEPVPSLDPSFTVGSQLTEVVRRHLSLSRTASRHEVLRLLELVELPDPRGVAGKYPHELSGGMAQRVAIAAALAGRPDLLIADEPTTALDVTVQAEILELLRSLRAKTGLGLLLVSHDWGVIADICDAAIIMYAGQRVEVGEISELFVEPRHPYTRGLMTSNPYYASQPRTPLASIPGSVLAVGNWPEGCHFASRCRFVTPECVESPVVEETLEMTHRVRCIHHDALAALPALGRSGDGA
jgi:peptide/nickel transport system permease protein